MTLHLSFEKITHKPANNILPFTKGRELPVTAPNTGPTNRHQLGEDYPSLLYSSQIKGALSGGFFIAFCIAVGMLFGLITLFASLVIEPHFDLKLVQYERHVKGDR